MGHYSGGVGDREGGAGEERGWEVAEVHPTFRSPPEKLDLLGGEVLTAYHRRGPVVFLDVLADDQPPLAKVLGHRRSRVRGGVLDVRVVHVPCPRIPGALESLARAVPIPSAHTPHYQHPSAS